MRHRSKGRWELEYIPSRDGHAYFWDWKSGPEGGFRYRVGVADQSGETPEETDDGVLYLDHSRPIVPISAWSGWTEGGSVEVHPGCRIPLVRPDGSKTSTIATRQEAFFVAERFRMRIED